MLVSVWEGSQKAVRAFIGLAGLLSAVAGTAPGKPDKTVILEGVADRKEQSSHDGKPAL